MKKTKFTFFKMQTLKLSLLMCLFSFVLVQSTNAQCTMVCNGMTNISLDNPCMTEITVDMVADTSGCDGTSFTVVVNDINGVPIGNTVDASHVGQTLEVVVTDDDSGNPCWGYILVEDKLPPTIECSPVVLDAYCYSNLDSFAIKNGLVEAFDNCEDITPTLVNTVIEPNDCTLDSNILRVVTQRFVAIDKYLNKSDECEISFNVVRLDDLSDITFPISLMVSTGNSLSCQDYPNGATPDTTLENTGVPIYITPDMDTIPLFPEPYDLCNLTVTVSDLELPEISCTRKIMRTWKVFEWSCEVPQRTETFTQVIEIADTIPPTISCPNAITASTNNSACMGYVSLPAAVINDNCSTQSEMSVQITFNNLPLLSTNGGYALLPKGTNTVTYTVFDKCFKPASCDVIVTVVDNTPPVVICEQNTVVSLSSDGCAFVPTTVFDDGSYDECSGVTLSVARMIDGTDPCSTNSNCSLEDDLNFDDQVRFCCADIGNTVMVRLRATDSYGNSNECMVEVLVQNKLEAQVSCPGPGTEFCDFNYDTADLDALFGFPEFVSSACTSFTYQDSIDDSGVSKCGIGDLLRIFYNESTGETYCTQVITLNPLYPLFDEEDIDWPELVINIDQCGDPDNFDPEDLVALGYDSYPSYSGGACSLVGESYKDQIFNIGSEENNTTCYKILRTWTVIDWCQFTSVNGNSYFDEWKFVQTIKISDTDGPYNLEISRDTLNVSTPDCDMGSFELTASAQDDCTQTLDYTYTVFIDAQNDGKFNDIFVHNGIAQQFTYTGNSATIEHTYPTGSYKVEVRFLDRCGNSDVVSSMVNISSNKAPTPYLYTNLAIVLMDDGQGGGMIDTWANDFEKGSTHECGYDVKFSFTPFVLLNDTLHGTNGINFTCDSVGEHTLTIYVGSLNDAGQIVESSAEVVIDVQDSQCICDASTNCRVAITGNISTPISDMLVNAAVELEGSEMDYEMTDEAGKYAFPTMDVGGSYTVSPQKNDDYMNGVSTLDLVMIQRHILEIEIFNTPYKYLAGDVNNDERITSQDLLLLRKLILGVVSELPDNGSWRFVDSEFEFFDPTDPLSTDIPSTYQISNLDGDMEINFIGVKVGDINDNAEYGLTGGKSSNTRSDQSISLITNEYDYSAGDVVTVPVRVNEEIMAAGMQFTITVENGLSFTDFSSELMNISSHNLSINSNGNIMFSWDNYSGLTVNENEVLFTLEFRASQSGNISNAINITSDNLAAEIYDTNLEIYSLDFEVENRDNTTNNTFELYQNSPNPFGQSTKIAFNLPNAEKVSFRVLDMTGKVVYSSVKTYEKGFNQIELTQAQLGTSGIYYYLLEAGEFRGSKKMILIE